MSWFLEAFLMVPSKPKEVASEYALKSSNRAYSIISNWALYVSIHSLSREEFRSILIIYHFIIPINWIRKNSSNGKQSGLNNNNRPNAPFHDRSIDQLKILIKDIAKSLLLSSYISSLWKRLHRGDTSHSSPSKRGSRSPGKWPKNSLGIRARCSWA